VIGSQEQFITNVLTRRPKDWAVDVVATSEGTWSHIKEYVGKVHACSANAEDFRDTDIWIIAGPSNISPEVLRQIASVAKPGCTIGRLYGEGGFD